MKLEVTTKVDHRCVAGQPIAMGPGGASLSAMMPGGCTTCYWSSSCTSTCGVVQTPSDLAG